ncbi:acyl-CoA dehydrogenase family protein [Plantactinospora endophytica]|uniref:acyl-CoA dehydrogenase family protein n=1 Tax=Plantactinospora endophytica TaxID=673535 RepID=UPI001EF37E7D|nr:acyl-CoA dehydrogenase family protein [Plantactinospora endophytica]
MLEAAARVRTVLRQHADAADEEARVSEPGMAELRRSGLMGLLVPQEHGGLGGDLADLVEIAQLLADGCTSTAMIWAMHCQQTDALVRFAAPALRDRLLPRVARGELYLASITTGPGTSGHLLSNASPLSGTTEGLQVLREAPIVTGGTHAEGFLITMRSSPDAPESEISLVYADREQLDVVERQDWDTLGMRGTHSLGLKLTGVVPRSQVVGEDGGFRTVALESMAPVGHLAWAACWLGAARSALGGLVGLLRSPERPRSIDVRSELVAERLARIRMDLELVGGYLHRVTDEVGQLRAAGSSLAGTATQIHLNTLKVTAAELTFRSVDRMVQLAGLSVGYRRRSSVPLERHFRDLRSAALNYSNDRLLTATGALTLMDRSVQLA